MSYVDMLRAVSEHKEQRYQRAAEIHSLLRRRREARLAASRR